MPRDGSGNFNLPAGNPVSANTVVSSTWANSTLNDLGAALTQSLSKDGQTVPTANLSMGNNKITSLANGTLATDAATFGQTGGRLLNIQVFTASGTYTPTAGTNAIFVELLGAGGAGGGAVPTGAGAVSGGSGGGAGAFVRGWFTSGFSGQAVTIGAGGVGSISASGGNGGTTSLGALISSTGGAGGVVAAAAASAGSTGGAGGTGSAGLPSSTQGSSGQTFTAAFVTGAFDGAAGASTPFGAGGVSVFVGAGGNLAGNAGSGYGAGGGGALNNASAAAGRAGGNGTSGFIIIHEYA